jgi:hypothetical protein
MSKHQDRNAPYLAILIERQLGGGQKVHAGLARHGQGTPMCDDSRRLLEFHLAASDPQFALYRTAGWRHRYAEAFLELNRGCQHCLSVLYQIADEVGWAKPPSLRT